MRKYVRTANDHRRFQPALSSPDTCHRHYHGGPQVELVFRLADWWLRRSAASNARSGSSENEHIPATLSVFSRR